MRTTSWTKEEIAKLIIQFSSLKQFKKKYSGAYDAMRRNKWDDLKDLLQRTVTVQDNTPKWTPEHIKELAKECRNIKDFSQKYPRAYEKICDKKWFYLLNGIRTKSATVNWTRAMISKLIAKCDSLNEFRCEYTAAYQAMIRNNWHDLADGLTRNKGMANTEMNGMKWSVYRWYFREHNTVYIGLTKNFRQRIKDELRYSTASPVKDFLSSTGCSYEVHEIYTGLSSEEASRLEIETIKASKEAGYQVLNRNRGGALGGGHAEPGYTKVYIIAKYDKTGKYCGSIMREDGRIRVEEEAIRMEMSNECSRAEVIPVVIPWKTQVCTDIVPPEIATNVYTRLIGNQENKTNPKL